MVESTIQEEEDQEIENNPPTDIWMGFMTSELAATHRSFLTSTNNDDRPNMGVINSGLLGHNSYSR